MQLADLSLQRGALPIDLDRERICFFDMPATWLLIQKFGPQFALALYRVPNPKVMAFELVSMDALAYFLWAGLQADAKLHNEVYTLEQAEAAIHPWNYATIFQRVVWALVGATATPTLLGKVVATGEAAKPAAAPAKAAAKAAPKHPGPTRVSTSTKRSGSPSRSSAGSRKTSGRRAR